jgi:hypothetical protein
LFRKTKRKNIIVSKAMVQNKWVSHISPRPVDRGAAWVCWVVGRGEHSKQEGGFRRWD